MLRDVAALVLGGPLLLGLIAVFYALPSVFAIADVAGRPRSEWEKPRHRTVWIVLLSFSIPGAITLIPQTMAILYAVFVPRKVRSERAVAGARSSLRRAYSALGLGVLAFGPLLFSSGPDNSDHLMTSSVATTTAIVFVCVLVIACGHRPGALPRAAAVAISAIAAGAAGWVAREAWFDSCFRGCDFVPHYTTWVVPAYAAAGALVAVVSTRTRPATSG